jgi:hypothetical protein
MKHGGLRRGWEGLRLRYAVRQPPDWHKECQAMQLRYEIVFFGTRTQRWFIGCCDGEVNVVELLEIEDVGLA